MSERTIETPSIVNSDQQAIVSQLKTLNDCKSNSFKKTPKSKMILGLFGVVPILVMILTVSKFYYSEAAVKRGKSRLPPPPKRTDNSQTFKNHVAPSEYDSSQITDPNNPRYINKDDSVVLGERDLSSLILGRPTSFALLHPNKPLSLVTDQHPIVDVIKKSTIIQAASRITQLHGIFYSLVADDPSWYTDSTIIGTLGVSNPDELGETIRGAKKTAYQIATELTRQEPHSAGDIRLRLDALVERMDSCFETFNQQHSLFGENMNKIHNIAKTNDVLAEFNDFFDNSKGLKSTDLDRWEKIEQIIRHADGEYGLCTAFTDGPFKITLTVSISPEMLSRVPLGEEEAFVANLLDLTSGSINPGFETRSEEREDSVYFGIFKTKEWFYECYPTLDIVPVENTPLFKYLHQDRERQSHFYFYLRKIWKLLSKSEDLGNLHINLSFPNHPILSLPAEDTHVCRSFN